MRFRIYFWKKVLIFNKSEELAKLSSRAPELGSFDKNELKKFTYVGEDPSTLPSTSDK